MKNPINGYLSIKQRAANIVTLERERIRQQSENCWQDRINQAERDLLKTFERSETCTLSMETDQDTMDKPDCTLNEQSRLVSQKKLEIFLNATKKLERIKTTGENVELINPGEDLQQILFNPFLIMDSCPARNTCIKLTTELLMQKEQKQEFHVEIVKQMLMNEDLSHEAIKLSLVIYAQKLPVLTALTLAEYLQFILQYDSSGQPCLGIKSLISSKLIMDILDDAISKFDVDHVSNDLERIMKLHRVFQELADKIKEGFGIQFAMVEWRVRRSVVNFVGKFEQLDQVQDDSIVRKVYQMMKRRVVPDFVMDNC